MKLKTLTLAMTAALGVAATVNAADETKIRFDGFPDFDSSLKVSATRFRERNGH